MRHVFLSILPYATGCPKIAALWQGGDVRLCLISDYPAISQTAAEMGGVDNVLSFFDGRPENVVT